MATTLECKLCEESMNEKGAWIIYICTFGRRWSSGLSERRRVGFQNIKRRVRKGRARKREEQKAKKKAKERYSASAANRTRGPSMATMDFTTKPLTLF